MKIEKFRVGGIEHGAIRIGKKLIGGYTMPNWEDASSTGYISIGYKDKYIEVTVPCMMEDLPTIVCGPAIDRNRNTVLTYILNRVINELNIEMPIKIER